MFVDLVHVVLLEIDLLLEISGEMLLQLHCHLLRLYSMDHIGINIGSFPIYFFYSTPTATT